MRKHLPLELQRWKIRAAERHRKSLSPIRVQKKTLIKRWNLKLWRIQSLSEKQDTGSHAERL